MRKEKVKISSKLIVEKVTNGYIFRWQSLSPREEYPGEPYTTIVAGSSSDEKVDEEAGRFLMCGIFTAMGGEEEDHTNKIVEVTLNFQEI